jgi:hypothetical protein
MVFGLAQVLSWAPNASAQGCASVRKGAADEGQCGRRGTLNGFTREPRPGCNSSGAIKKKASRHHASTAAQTIATPLPSAASPRTHERHGAWLLPGAADTQTLVQGGHCRPSNRSAENLPLGLLLFRTVVKDQRTWSKFREQPVGRRAVNTAPARNCHRSNLRIDGLRIRMGRPHCLLCEESRGVQRLSRLFLAYLTITPRISTRPRRSFFALADTDPSSSHRGSSVQGDRACRTCCVVDRPL